MTHVIIVHVCKKKNKLKWGSISVQILEKTNRTNKLIQTVGSSKDEIEIERLYNRDSYFFNQKSDEVRKNSLPSFLISK